MLFNPVRLPLMSQPSHRWWVALGPAFVAAMAYVDPGNVAANMSAGARYGYLLTWALVAASAMAMLIQYLSAKLGVVTARSLGEHISGSLESRPTARRLFAWQAVAVAIATDLAEVVGGAIALYLLFGLPPWLGGLLVAVVSYGLLEFLRIRGENVFELVVVLLLAIIATGFLASLWWSPPDPRAALAGLIPRFEDAGSVQLAAAMLGATVMPHAIYLHSILARDRHRSDVAHQPNLPRLLRIQRLDVFLALMVAGSVNVAMLLFAADTLQGTTTDTIEAAHSVIKADLGQLPAIVFALGLLVSSVGSTVVGTHTGARLIKELTTSKLGHLERRALTVIPAVLLLVLGVDPTQALVLSQLALSFGISFALVPLVRYTSNRTVMGSHANGRLVRVLSWLVASAIIALNLAVLVTTI